MPTPFACPHCGDKTLVDDTYAGQSGPCANCNKQITIPTLSHAGPSLLTTGNAGKTLQQTRKPGNPAISPKTGPTSVLMIAVIVIGGLLSALTMAGALFTIILPTVDRSRLNAQHSTCTANLKKIAVALNSYAKRKGTYPPAYTVNAQNRPMHSWRTLILEDLNEPQAFRNYDFALPWDQQPNDWMLKNDPPAVFSCPADSNQNSASDTSYVLITGAETLFPGAATTKPVDVSDGLNFTVMVVEMHNSGIQWYEPTDIEFANLQFQINSGGQYEIRSDHPGGAHVVTADETVHFIDQLASLEDIRAIMTIQGGEAFIWETITQ